MKKNSLNRLLMLIFLTVSPVWISAQQQLLIKDAFVLIDVSGSMRDDVINREAKQLIKNILLGQFSLSDADKQGWAIPHKCDIIENNRRIIQNNSFLAIIPVGAKDRYNERKFRRLSNVDNEFGEFFENSYRLDHGDQLTYLSLAQGYAGSLANAQKVAKSYMIIYSDGLNDETGSLPYLNYENSIVDSWNLVGVNKYSTLGILYRKSGAYTYKIYIGQLDLYDVVIREEDKINDETVLDTQPVLKITITNPKNSLDRLPAKAKTKEDVSVSWIGAMDANVSITKYNGKNYGRLLPSGKEEAKMQSKGSNFAKIVFYESGKYKITVSKGSISDSAFYEISSPFPAGLILGLIILLIVVITGLKYLPDIIKPKPTYPSPSSNGKDDDW